jgi:hypothetical protein
MENKMNGKGTISAIRNGVEPLLASNEPRTTADNKATI